jgi:hypothetical protein
MWLLYMFKNCRDLIKSYYEEKPIVENSSEEEEVLVKEEIIIPKWPNFTLEEMHDFYGYPGENLKRFSLPYPMRLAWDKNTIISTSVAHIKCAEYFEEALLRIYEFYGGFNEVRHLNLDLFGGIYNYRTMTNSTRLSSHAWAVSIDLNPDENRYGWTWPGKAKMPVEVVEIFESLGAVSGARWKNNPDAMHQQFCR